MTHENGRSLPAWTAQTVSPSQQAWIDRPGAATQSAHEEDISALRVSHHENRHMKHDLCIIKRSALPLRSRSLLIQDCHPTIRYAVASEGATMRPASAVET